MQVNSIESINPIALKNSANSIDKNNPTFANMLNNAITDVNNEQKQGYNAMQQIATGEVQNLQKAVQQIGKAELSLKLGLEVKNKALNAYKEVMRMQI